MSRCSVQDNSTARSCLAGCTNETTSGHRGRAARSRGPMGVHDSGDNASLWVVSPPYTTGLTKGGSRSRSRSHLASLSGFAFVCCSACLTCGRCLLTPPYLSAGSAHSTRLTASPLPWCAAGSTHHPLRAAGSAFHLPSRLLAPPTTFLACQPRLFSGPVHVLSPDSNQAGDNAPTLDWDRSAERPPKCTR